jgi:hypothetical protein
MPAHLYEGPPNTNLAYHVDSNKNEYFGDAPRGATTSQAKWRIYAIIYATPGNQESSWQIKYPNGSDMPIFVWDSVTSYQYYLLKDR